MLTFFTRDDWQAAQGDLVIGMSLWVHNLLPLAVGKSSTPVLRDTALQFLERCGILLHLRQFWLRTSLLLAFRISVPCSEIGPFI